MCSVTAMVIAGAGQAVAGNYAKAQQGSARNKLLAKQLKRQQRTVRGNTYNDRTAAYLRGVDAKVYQTAAVKAASSAGASVQREINDAIATALSNQQERAAQAIQNKSAKAAERGTTDARRGAALGRAQAAERAKVGRAIDDQSAKLREIRERMNLAIANKYKAIGILPEGDTGYMPTSDDVTWDRGMSPLAQIMNIGMGALSGYVAGSQLKAAGAFTKAGSESLKWLPGMEIGKLATAGSTTGLLAPAATTATTTAGLTATQATLLGGAGIAYPWLQSQNQQIAIGGDSFTNSWQAGSLPQLFEPDERTSGGYGALDETTLIA